QRPCRSKSRRRRKRARWKASCTTAIPWSVTAAPVEIHQLTAVTDQPVVVQGHDGGDASDGRLPGNARRETGQVLYMNDIGPPLVENAAGDSCNLGIAIARFKGVAGTKRVVDTED